MDKEQ